MILYIGSRDLFLRTRNEPPSITACTRITSAANMPILARKPHENSIPLKLKTAMHGWQTNRRTLENPGIQDSESIFLFISI